MSFDLPGTYTLKACFDPETLDVASLDLYDLLVR